jgi:hypothetical protein
MICCMPFTYVDDRYMRKLTDALGPVSVYGPTPELMPGHMLAWAQKEMLDLRYPEGVQAGHLSRALQEFKVWADLHQGDIADMAGFFKSRKGQPPLVDETNPTSIGDQIRNFSRQASQEPTDPIFRAALFLAMAQEYDQQHDAVAQDMGAVMAMEQVMLARLAGDAQDREEGFYASPAAENSAGSFDTGAFMTARRVQAWAELVCRDGCPQPFTLFVTASPAVFEHLLDHGAQVHGPLRANLVTGGNGAGDSNKTVLKALEALTCAKDPTAWSPDDSQDRIAGKNTADLVFYALAGISPHRFPYRLLGPGSRIGQPAASSDQGPVNTLVGLLER